MCNPKEVRPGWTWSLPLLCWAHQITPSGPWTLNGVWSGAGTEAPGAGNCAAGHLWSRQWKGSVEGNAVAVAVVRDLGAPLVW